MVPRCLRVLLFSTVAMSASAGWAQDSAKGAAAAPEPSGAGAAQAGNAIGEIVVTAQRRAENVQRVPIAVTAITSEALEARGITSVAALTNLAPNTTLDAGTPFSGSGSVLAAYIRGIGSNDFAFNIDPGVGVYLDGVYLARTVGANQDLLDVERIEVLKGPQGTLFGRNTIGGAISIVTHDPGHAFAFKGEVTTGSFRRLDARGTADIPFTPALGATVSFGVTTRNGYMKRIPFPFDQPYLIEPSSIYKLAGYDTARREGGDDSWNGRIKLKWDDGGRVRATVVGDYSRTDSTATPATLLGTTEFVPGPFAGLAQFDLVTPGGPTALDVVSGTSGFLFAGLYNFCINSDPAQIAARNAQALCGVRGTPLNPAGLKPAYGGANVDADPLNNRLPYDSRFITGDRDKSYSTGPNFSKLTSWGLLGILEGDLSSEVTLKSITGYREVHWNAGMDYDGSPLNILHLTFDMNQKQFSQEVQVLGSLLDNSLKFVLGGYYFQESGDLLDNVTTGAGFLEIDGPNTFDTKNAAVFGQIDWRVMDLIGVTLGGRYTHEKKRFEGGQSDLNGFNYKLFNCPIYGDPCSTALGFPNPSQPLRYYVTGEQRKSFNNFSPKVGLQVYAAPDVMGYGSWSRGYKTGGWTTRLSNPLPYAPDFDEEKAETFEIGLKSRFLDRRVQLNLAAFTTKYKGIQLNFQQGISPTLQNSGNARIKGFEVEATALLIEGLRIDGSIGYTDARYTSVEPASQVAPNFFQAGVFRGASLPKAPKWKVNLSPQYTLTLAGGGALIFLADYTHTTAIWNDTERSFLLRRPSTDLLNLSVTFRPSGQPWELTVGGTNVTDERFVMTGLTNIAAGTITGTYNRPAEWYVTGRVHF